jgi:hypothetical protein
VSDLGLGDEKAENEKRVNMWRGGNQKKTRKKKIKNQKLTSSPVALGQMHLRDCVNVALVFFILKKKLVCEHMLYVRVGVLHCIEDNERC